MCLFPGCIKQCTCGSSGCKDEWVSGCHPDENTGETPPRGHGETSANIPGNIGEGAGLHPVVSQKAISCKQKQPS